MADSKNNQKLISFTQYCLDNPEQRFWQALRNWAWTDKEYGDKRASFILKAQHINFDTGEFEGIKDTFYEE